MQRNPDPVDRHTPPFNPCTCVRASPKFPAWTLVKSTTGDHPCCNRRIGRKGDVFISMSWFFFRNKSAVEPQIQTANIKYVFSFGHIRVSRCMCIVSQNRWTIQQYCIKEEHPFSYTMLHTSPNPTWRNQTRSNYIMQRIQSCLNTCDPVPVQTIEPWTCTCFFEDVVWFKSPEMFHSRILDYSVKWHYHISQLRVVRCCNSKTLVVAVVAVGNATVTHLQTTLQWPCIWIPEAPSVHSPSLFVPRNLPGR